MEVFSFFYFVNFFLSFFLSIFIFFNYFKKFKDKRVSFLIHLFLFLGILLFIFSFGIFLKWNLDFLFLLFIFFHSLFWFCLFYFFIREKKIWVLFLSFLLICIVLFFIGGGFEKLIFGNSFLFVLLLFFYLLFRHDVYQKVGFFGIFYTCLGVCLSLLYFFGLVNIHIFVFIIFFFLFCLVFLFLYDLKKYSFNYEDEFFFEEGFFFNFLRHFVFVVAIINIIFIFTVVVHELGHYVVSFFYDCSYRGFIFNEGFVVTKIICSEISNPCWVLLGGVLLPFLFSVFFLFSKKCFFKSFFFFFAGFNLIIISHDLRDLGVEFLIKYSIFFGIFCLIVGIFLFSKEKLRDLF